MQDPLLEDFKDHMYAIGVHVENIYYSIAYSQGDGACFAGSVVDWGLYLEHLGYSDPILIQMAEQTWSLKWSHKGHYYHEHSVYYDDDLSLGFNPYDEEEDTLRYDTWENHVEQFDLLELVDAAKENLRGHMKTLFGNLQEDYEYLISDEAVIETLMANDVEPELK